MTEQIDYDPNTVLEALNNKADRDLNNVTDGTYQVLTTKNITNCITKIPQDIKLELNDGTLTLKAGSKVYDGAGNPINITVDINVEYGNASENLVYCAGKTSNYLIATTIINCSSGATAPVVPSPNRLIWYDTTNKKVYTYSPNSSEKQEVSLPIFIANSLGNNKFELKQVFNGFGYIGSTIFALPGIEGLIPNGRNTDGSLNNKSFKITSVLTANALFNANLASIVVNSTFLTMVTDNNVRYDNNNNFNFLVNNNDKYFAAFVGIVSIKDLKITSFNPKTTFQILDRNDKEEIISRSMPDYDAGIDITTYTSTSNQFVAPCAGFINVVYLAQASNSACPHIGNKTFGSYNEGAIADNVTLLISEGETFYCTGMYTNKGNGSNMFYPMKGAV